MFWHYLRGFRRKATHIADLIPWVDAVDPARQRVIRCKDESLFAVWQVEPLDLESLTDVLQGQVMLALNSAWKRLPGDWGIWLTTLRQRPALPDGADQGAHPVPTLIEADHRATYDPTLWGDQLYLVLWRQAPLLALAETLSDVVYTGSMGL